MTNDKGEKEITTAFAREEETKKGMDGSQITGASSSYARKYALNGLFCIDDAKDSDSTNTHGKEETQQPAKTPVSTDKAVYTGAQLKMLLLKCLLLKVVLNLKRFGMDMKQCKMIMNLEMPVWKWAKFILHNDRIS